MTRGIIALDIDGTLVTQHQPLSLHLSSFLKGLHQEGWQILFATGRTIRWSMEHLATLPFPFYLAPYNGACIFSFPSRESISSSLLEFADVMKLAPYVDEFGAVIYEAGGEERIFFTPKCFSEGILHHLLQRQQVQNEEWIPLKSIQRLPHVKVAGVRFFLTPGAALLLGETINSVTSLRAPTMKDSFHDAFRIVQVTAEGASKGQALRILRNLWKDEPAIAAGDDMNDVDLLEEADIGIAMASSPDELKKIAQVVAPSEGEDPIIEALTTAMQKLLHFSFQESMGGKKRAKEE